LTASDKNWRANAMRLLYDSDAVRLGRRHAETSWRWTGESTVWVDHFGSLALTLATVDLQFDRIAA
jgi:hypothetical protein